MNRIYVTTIIIATVLAVLSAPASAVVWYVDIDNTSGTEDDTSWATAYTDIQSAVDAASGAGGGEVWVTEGTYTATTDPVWTMAADVYIYGGGMYNESSSPTVTNCVFSGNSADEDGGGVYNTGSSEPVITN